MPLKTPTPKQLALVCLLIAAITCPDFLRAAGPADSPPVVCPDDFSPPVPDGHRTRDWIEQVKRIGTDTDTDDLYGQSVAIDGNYAIVGASRQTTGGTRAGAVYIYRLDPGGWVEEVKLLPDDPENGMSFGYYVDIEGETAIIGAHLTSAGGSARGAAYIFTRSGTTWTQQQKITASDGQDADFFGHGVRLDGNLAVVGAYGVGVDRGAAYVFSRSGTVWTEQQKLTGDELGDGSGVINGDRFGISVSIDAGTIVVGADQFRTADGPHGGTAYVYVDVNGTWTQQAKLEADDTQDLDRLGFTVDIFGDYVIAGARHEDTGGGNAGAAYIFKRESTTWAQQAKLQPKDHTAGNNFGINVTINDGLVAVGAFNEGTKGARAGSAYVFELDGAVWKEQTKLLASDGAAGDLFGRSVSIDHGRIISSSNHQGSAGADAGAVYFFAPTYALDPLIYPVCTNSTTVPAPKATDNCDGTVTATTTDQVTFTESGNYTIEWVYTDAAGNRATAIQHVSLAANLTGPVPTDALSFTWVESTRMLAGSSDREQFFGSGVAMDGEYAVVGLGNEDATKSGAAYVYFHFEGSWFEIAELLATDTGADQAFGHSVAISGDLIAVGAYAESIGATSPGAVYLYERDGVNWNFTQKIESPENPATDHFGFDVALSGDRLMIGAPEGLSTGTTTGAAYVYERGSGDWSTYTKLLASDGTADDEFGYSVAIDGDYLVVGADLEDTDGTNSGAAYVYEHTGSWAQVAKLKADVPEGQSYFGHDVSISGSRLVVGSDSDGEVADNSGAAYVFDRGLGGWSTQHKLIASDAAQNDFFGRDVAIHANRILVGADRVGSNPLEAGAAYVFDYEAGSWYETTQLFPSEVEGYANFGNQVALSGDRLLVGAPHEDADFMNAGAAYFFTLQAELPPVLLSSCKPTAVAPAAISSCGVNVSGKTDDPQTYSEEGNYEIRWTFSDPDDGTLSLATQEVSYVEVSVRIPYFEPFDTGTAERDCWETIDVAGDGGWRISDDPAHSDTGIGAYFLPPSTGGQDDRLLSPELNFFTGFDYRLVFDHRAIGTAATEHLRVSLVNPADGTEVKQLFEDDDLASTYTDAPLVINVPAHGNYRIAFESQSAAGSEGILLDNFAVIPEFAPTDGASQLLVSDDDATCYSATAPGLHGDAWTTFIGTTSKRFVEINANGNDLGDVLVEMTDYATPPLSPFLGEQVMSRYFNITPEKGSGPYDTNGGVKIRVYFTDAELAEFNSARGFNADWSDLIITHYDGADEDCTIGNSNEEDFDLLLQSSSQSYGNNAHYVEFYTTSFSEFGATSASGFPVVLTDFAARAEGANNLLEWGVATETDFSHYTVQRSIDGITFVDLGRVEGTHQPRYSLTDLAPAALRYYRLKMVDHDGSYSLSPVVSVTRKSESTGMLDVYPVPTSDRLTLSFAATQQADCELIITDALGRRVDTRHVVAIVGANLLELSLDGLSPGPYHLTLRGGSTLLHARTVKR